MIDFADIFSKLLENGEIMIGLSAGTDQALLEADKLKVLPSTSPKLMSNATSKDRQERDRVSAYANIALSYIPVADDEFIEKLTCDAVTALFYFGLVSRDNPDVESMLESQEGIYDHNNEYNLDRIKNVTTLIIATKMNLFQTNHHTGQGSLSGMPLKVYNQFYNDKGENPVTPTITSLIHKFGHWACTRKILSKLKIPGIRKSSAIAGLSEFGLTSDILLRTGMMPAGTASLGLCYSIAKKLASSKLAYGVRDPSVFPKVVKAYKVVQSNRARYHISSKYLTGDDRIDYDDSEFTSLLGLFGSYIYNLFPRSSICRSPKIKKGERPVYREYDGYDEGFEMLCVSVKKGQMKGIPDDLKFFLESSADTTEERIKEIKGILDSCEF